MENQPFGSYNLLEHMGRGGMASVYRASDGRDGSIVAVKIFQPDEKRPADVTRKLRDREVRMLVSVQHPNIVQYRDSGEIGEDYFYYSMEFVEESLLTRMRAADDFDLIDKVLILRQTASALLAIHRQGIVHRDVKPGNILLDEDPNGAIHVKLTDLGIAKNVSETDIVREQARTRVPGTAKYLSPEQIRLQAVDGRSDIFGLGIAAYELLTGEPPFKARTADDYLAANRTQEQRPAHEVDPSIPEFLSEMVDQMLVKDREDRYDSDTLARDLELAQQHLISGAPMVERTNPASMFYEVPLDLQEARRRGRPSPIAPVSWALAVAILLAGASLTVLLWPAEASARGAVPPPAPTGAEVADEAQAAALAGRHWQVVALNRAAGRGSLDGAAATRLQEAYARSQSSLADQYLRAARRMLDAGRSREAEIVLRAMQEFLPDAEQTARLAGELQETQHRVASVSEWEDALRRSEGLARRRRYAEALAIRRAVLGGLDALPAKQEEARRGIGDLLQEWGEYVASGYTGADAIEAFLRATDENAAVAPGRPSAKLKGELRLKLGDLYRDREDFEAARDAYTRATRGTDPEIAERAQTALTNLTRWLEDRPHQPAEFAAQLTREGFGGALWREENEDGTSQTAADGRLVIRAWGPGEKLAYRETARPVRNLGFNARVEFLASAPMAAQSGLAALGIGLIGVEGNAVEISFDGADYAVTVTTRGDTPPVRREIARAVKDEDKQWHALGASYNFQTGTLGISLDGRRVHRTVIDLSDFRIRVFLRSSAEESVEASFGNVHCLP
jgi:serine/threonine-protein kinase